jgi:hypothetical protein
VECARFEQLLGLESVKETRKPGKKIDVIQNNVSKQKKHKCTAGKGKSKIEITFSEPPSEESRGFFWLEVSTKNTIALFSATSSVPATSAVPEAGLARLLEGMACASNWRRCVLSTIFFVPRGGLYGLTVTAPSPPTPLQVLTGEWSQPAAYSQSSMPPSTG